MDFLKGVASISARTKDIEIHGNAIGNAIVLCMAPAAILVIMVLFFGSNIIAKIKISEIPYAKESLVISTLSVPLYLMSTIILNYYEGLIKIKYSVALKLFSSISILIIPFILSKFSANVVAIAAGFLISRVMNLLFSFYFLSKDKVKIKVKLKEAEHLIHFGGWLTLSNLVSPIMSVGDKYYLSTLYSSTVVAPYSIANEAVMRLLAFPAAIGRALFPVLSTITNKKNILSYSYIAMISFGLIVLLPIYIYAGEIVGYWLGFKYVNDSSRYLRILIVGLFFVSLAQIPYSYIQAKFGTKPTAILHVLELPFYLVLLYSSVNSYGVIGAAYAWTIRLVVDYILLEIISRKMT